MRRTSSGRIEREQVVRRDPVLEIGQPAVPADDELAHPREQVGEGGRVGAGDDGSTQPVSGRLKAGGPLEQVSGGRSAAKPSMPLTSWASRNVGASVIGDQR